MQIEIQARDFTLTESLGSYIERRINFFLSSKYDQIKRIRVSLSDINGPRGGVDKRCQIQISLPRLKDIVIEDTELDLYIAIDRATDRIARTVNRRLARQHTKKRKLYVSHKRDPIPILNEQNL